MFGNRMTIDPDLLRRCQARARRLGFDRVEDFIERELSMAFAAAGNAPADEEPQRIRELRGLGYID